MSKVKHILDRPHLCHALFLFGSVALTGSAFFIEHVLNAIPCQMCWWQRYVHWAIGFLAFSGYYAGWIAKGRIYTWPIRAYKYLLALCLGGLYIAVWQSLGQRGLAKLPESCSSNAFDMTNGVTDFMAQLQSDRNITPPCDEVNFYLLGHSLSDWNIVVMGGYIIAILTAWVYARHTNR